jgi:hypothetical protein
VVISFKDDVTVILLLSVSFMVEILRRAINAWLQWGVGGGVGGLEGLPRIPIRADEGS